MDRNDKTRQMQTLAQCWEKFKREAIPANANAKTVDNAQMVFYAGAAFMLDQNLAVSDPSVPEAVGVAHMESISKELHDYTARLGAKVAAGASRN